MFLLRIMQVVRMMRATACTGELPQMHTALGGNNNSTHLRHVQADENIGDSEGYCSTTEPVVGL